jgi:serine/threonine protein phosphatase PrpC
MAAFDLKPLYEIEMKSNSNSHFVTITNKEKQLSKQQDYTIKGHYKNKETDEEFDWIALFDGHGTNRIIDKIKNIDLEKFIATDNPPLALQNFLTNENILSKYESSGSTMCVAKIYKEHIQCFTVGDSYLFVYQDGVKIYSNPLHKWHNESEINRLKKIDSGLNLTDSITFEVIAENIMTSLNSKYLNFSNGLQIAPTQTIGHNNITGISPETFYISLIPNSDYRIVMASDGVFDVLMNDEDEILEFSKKSCDEIVELAENRWKQSWYSVVLSNEGNDSESNKLYGPFKFTDPHHFDDISVIIADIHKV